MEWFQKRQLGFNESKCKVLHLGSENERRRYQMGVTVLEMMTSVKDLGVFIDKLGTQVRPACCKSCQQGISHVWTGEGHFHMPLWGDGSSTIHNDRPSASGIWPFRLGP